MKAAIAIFTAVVALFLTLPIWFYLVYKILVLVNATDLMWFLYWVYVPFTILIHTSAALIKAASD